MHISEMPKIVQLWYKNLPNEQKDAFYDEYDRKKKSTGVAYLLWFLLGWHYAYVKKWGLLALFILTCGGLFIWMIIDLFRIPSIIRNFNKDVAIKVMRNMQQLTVYNTPTQTTQSDTIKKVDVVEVENQQPIVRDIKSSSKLTNKTVNNLSRNREKETKKTNKKQLLYLGVVIVLFIMGFFFREDLIKILGYKKIENASISDNAIVYKGFIDKKYPITMKFSIKDDSVQGFYSYDKIGLPIKIKGTINNNSIELNSIYDNSSIRERFSGVLDNNSIQGEWYNFTKNTSYGFSVLKTDVKVEISEQGRVLSQDDYYIYHQYFKEYNKNKILRNQKKGSKLTGVYVKNSYNKISIIELNNNKIYFKLEVSNGRNLGELEGIVPKEKRIVFTQTDYGFCKFNIALKKEKIEIKTLDNGYDCGYGNGVVGDGIYFRRLNKKVAL